MQHLVVGGGGFIGRHLIGALSEAGNAVAVIDRSPAVSVPPGVTWSVHDFVAGPSAEPLPQADVLHCLVGAYRGNDAGVFAANVHALHHALASLASPPGLVVYVGAGSVYGESAEMITEARAPSPTTVYGLAKWLAESVLVYHANRLGFPYVILRPTNVYGPGNRKNVFWAFYEAYRKNGAVTVFGDGLQSRDFVYIGDFMDLMRRIIDPSRRQAASNQVFNVAGTQSHTVLDVVRAMSRALGTRIPVKHEVAEGGVLVDFKMSTEKAERLLGWKARMPFDDGVRVTVASYAAG